MHTFVSFIHKTRAHTNNLANSSYYTRRKFRPIYAKVMNSYVNTCRKSSTFQRHPGANSMSLVTGLLPFTSEMALFEFPFNELLVRNIIMNQNMNCVGCILRQPRARNQPNEAAIN